MKKAIVVHILNVFLVFGQTSAFAAGIITDPNASAANRASVSTASNGTDVVNIAAPSAAGVSHNQYQQFNINAAGAVFNNSSVRVNTALAGAIDGNSNLNGSAANIILNEVTSANASMLQGLAEVAGQSAEFIVANPNGITCNGCGFLNTPQVTLTTGTPELNNGALEAFRIDKGEIHIEGLGFNGSNLDKVKLYSRALNINANIFTSELEVVTGRNNIKNSTGAVTALADDGSAQPGVSVDSTSLGGIYANKITLQGTEAGVGVNLQGVVSAGAGGLQLNSDGSISVKTVVADGQINMASASADINVTGSIYSKNTVDLEAKESIVLTEAILAAQGSIEARAKSIAINKSRLLAGVNPLGELGAAGDVSLVATEQVSIQESIVLAADQASIDALDINNNLSRLEANRLTLNTQNSLVNSGDLVARVQADITANGTGLDNSGNIISLGTLNISSDSSVENSHVIEAAKEVILQAASLDNSGGKLSSLGGLDSSVVVAGDIKNTAGLIQAQTESLLVKSTAGNIDNDNGNIVYSGNGELSVEAQGVSNQAGNIISKTNLELKSEADIDNSSGSILGFGETRIIAQTGTVKNSSGTVESAQGISLLANDLNNQQGIIKSTGSSALTIDTEVSINNQGGVIYSAGQKLGVISRGDLNNTSGTIISLGSEGIEITALSVSNIDAGKIASIADIIVVTDDGKVDNSRGSIEAGGVFDLTVQQFVNVEGVIKSSGEAGRQSTITVNDKEIVTGVRPSPFPGLPSSLIIDRVGLENSDGQILTSHDLNIDVDSSKHFDNWDAVIESAGAISISSRSLDNDAGTIRAGESFVIQGAVYNTDGKIISLGEGDYESIIHNGDTDNENGLIYTNNDRLMFSTDFQAGDDRYDALYNENGTIIHQSTNSEGALSIQKGFLYNEGGEIRSQSNIDVDVSSLENMNGLLQALNDIDIDVSYLGSDSEGGIDNVDGKIISGYDLTIKIDYSEFELPQETDDLGVSTAIPQTPLNVDDRVYAAINNADGSISTEELIGNHLFKLNTGLLNPLAQTSYMALNNLGGVMAAGNDLALTNTSDAELLINGDVSAANNLSITSDNVINVGNIIAKNELSLDLSGQLVNYSTISSQNEVAIEAALLLNISENAEISSLNKLSVDVKSSTGSTLTRSILNSGKIISNDVDLSATGFIRNHGLINAQNTAVLNAATIVNRSKILSANTLSITANKLFNINADLIAKNDLALTATTEDGAGPVHPSFGEPEPLGAVEGQDGLIANISGKIISSQGDVNINSDYLLNRQLRAFDNTTTAARDAFSNDVDSGGVRVLSGCLDCEDSSAAVDYLNVDGNINSAPGERGKALSELLTGLEGDPLSGFLSLTTSMLAPDGSLEIRVDGATGDVSHTDYDVTSADTPYLTLYSAAPINFGGLTDVYYSMGNGDIIAPAAQSLIHAGNNVVAAVGDFTNEASTIEAGDSIDLSGGKLINRVTNELSWGFGDGYATDFPEPSRAKHGATRQYVLQSDTTEADGFGTNSRVLVYKQVELPENSAIIRAAGNVDLDFALIENTQGYESSSQSSIDYGFTNIAANIDGPEDIVLNNSQVNPGQVANTEVGSIDALSLSQSNLTDINGTDLTAAGQVDLQSLINSGSATSGVALPGAPGGLPVEIIKPVLPVYIDSLAPVREPVKQNIVFDSEMIRAVDHTVQRNQENLSVDIYSGTPPVRNAIKSPVNELIKRASDTQQTVAIKERIFIKPSKADTLAVSEYSLQLNGNLLPSNTSMLAVAPSRTGGIKAAPLMPQSVSPLMPLASSNGLGEAVIDRTGVVQTSPLVAVDVAATIPTQKYYSNEQKNILQAAPRQYQGAAIAAGGQLNIKAIDFNNAQGSLLANSIDADIDYGFTSTGAIKAQQISFDTGDFLDLRAGVVEADYLKINSSGSISSSADITSHIAPLSFNAIDNISVAGSVSAPGELAFISQLGGISLAGNINSDNIYASALNGRISAAGTISAQDNLALYGDSIWTGGNITAHNALLKSTGSTQLGGVFSTSNALKISAASTRLAGTVNAGNLLSIDTGAFFAGGNSRAKLINIKASGQGDLSGSLHASEALAISANGFTSRVNSSLSSAGTLDLYSSANTSLLGEINSDLLSLHSSGDLNLGALLTANEAFINADNTIRLGGVLNTQAALNINAGQDLVLTQATLNAQGDASLVAGGDITLKRGQLITSSDSQTRMGTANKPVPKTMTNNQGIVTATKGNNFNIDGSLNISAGNDLSLEGASTYRTYSGDQRNSHYSDKLLGNVSQFNVKGDIALGAGRDLSLSQDINSKQSLSITAGRDLLLQSQQLESGFKKRTGRSKSSGKTITHATTDLTAAGNLILQAGNNLTAEGSQLKATGNLAINAGNKLHLQALQSVDEYHYKYKKKSTFKTVRHTIDELSVTNNAANLTAGGNVFVNMGVDEDGRLNTIGHGDVVLEGSDINAGGHAYLYAGQDLNVFAMNDIKRRSERKTKSRFGGLSSSGSDYRFNQSWLDKAEIKSAQDTRLLAGRNVTLVASDINAQNIILDAGRNGTGSLNILGAQETLSTYSKTWSKSLSVGDLISSVAKVGAGEFNIKAIKVEEDSEWDTQNTFVGTHLNATGSVRMNAVDDINLEGAFVDAGDLLHVTAGNNINLLTGISSSNTGSKHKEGFIGLEFADGGQINSERYQSVKDSLNTTTSIGSSLNAGGSAIFNAGQDMNIIGSSIVANDELSMDAGRDINLLTGTSTRQQKHEEEEIIVGIDFSSSGNSAEVFAGMQTTRSGEESSQSNAHGQFAGGGTNYGGAGSSLSASNISLSAGENILAMGSDLIAMPSMGVLPSLPPQGGNLILDAGNDITTLASVNDDSLSTYEESLRVGIRVGVQENVSSAVESVETAQDEGGAANTLRAVDAVSGLSGGAASVSVGYIMEWEKTESEDENSTTRSTQLLGNNITLNSGGDQTHQGTEANASNNINIDAGGDLNIISAQDTQSHEDKSANASVNIGLSSGSAAGGVDVGGALGYSNNESDNITHNNAHFTAGNTVDIKTGGDTTIKGGVVSGENIIAEVGGDLLVESQQDTGKVRGESANISASTSGSVSLGGGRTKGDSAWVDEQSGLLATNTVDVYVAGHTELSGGVINSESGDLTLDTQSLSHSNIYDNDELDSVNASIGFSVGQTDSATTQAGDASDSGGSNPINSIGYGATSIDKEQTNHATIGEGTITVRDDEANGTDSVASINRDIDNAQELTKDEHDEDDFYISQSSIKTVTDIATTNPIQTGKNIYAGGKNAFNDFLLLGQSVGGAVKDGTILNDLSLDTSSGATRGIVGRHRDSRLAYQATLAFAQTEQGKILANAEDHDPALVQQAEQAYVDAVSQALGITDIAQVKIVLGITEGGDVANTDTTGQGNGQSAGADRVLAAGAYEGDSNTIFANHGAGGTDIENAGDISNTLAHETAHSTGYDSESFADLLGSAGEMAFNTADGQHGLSNNNSANTANNQNTSSQQTGQEWRENAAQNQTIRNNNADYVNAQDLDLRQLNQTEQIVVQENAATYALATGQSLQDARNELLLQALVSVDSDYAGTIKNNPRAGAFLSTVSEGTLITNSDGTTGNAFTATIRDFNNNSENNHQLRDNERGGLFLGGAGGEKRITRGALMEGINNGTVKPEAMALYDQAMSEADDASGSQQSRQNLAVLGILLAPLVALGIIEAPAACLGNLPGCTAVVAEVANAAGGTMLTTESVGLATVVAGVKVADELVEVVDEAGGLAVAVIRGSDEAVDAAGTVVTGGGKAVDDIPTAAIDDVAAPNNQSSQTSGGDYLPAVRTGRVDVESGAKPDANEMKAGGSLSDLGYDVRHLATASDKGIADVRTADLYVSGMGNVDVYTPKGTRPTSIARGIESKNSQAPNVLVQSNLSSIRMNKIASMVWGKPKAKNINKILFQKPDGSIVMYNRP